MIAESDFKASSRDVAVIVTVRFASGGSAGALYVTEVSVGSERVPAPDEGEIDQVTPRCEVSF
jgi:hypothetical protein